MSDHEHPAIVTREWQNIETAPKDGTRILVYRRFGGLGISRWIAEPHNHWAGFVGYPPTHWMHLPEPPVKP